MKKMIGTILLLAVVVAGCVKLNYNDTTYTVTVTDKERIHNNNSSKYLVFTTDKAGDTLVFENVDTIFRGKFNSSNIQGQLKVGEKYNITVVGYRVPLLSMYQNIIKVEDATP